MTEASEKILGKVRGLLAKAADPGIPPEEADSFRQKADELMVKYAISQWQVQSADANDRDIIARQYDFSWYTEESGDTKEHKSTLWSIMLTVSRHCRVKIITYKPDFYGGTIPVVGLKSDLDWFDLLFTNIMTDFVAGLEPRPLPNLSFEENLARLKDAGMKWQRIVELLWNAGMISHEKYPTMPTQKQIHGMYLAGVYNRFCEENGRHRMRVSPTVWRRSYSEAYDGRLWERLAEMRRRTQRSQDSSGSGTELVLADIWTRVEHQALVLYPKRTEVARPRRGRTAQPRSYAYSAEAARAGRERADNVRLTASDKEIKLDKKELER